LRNAEILLRQNKVQQLYEMLTNVISRNEVLMNDNALLQRQIYKHESQEVDPLIIEQLQ